MIFEKGKKDRSYVEDDQVASTRYGVQFLRGGWFLCFFI